MCRGWYQAQRPVGTKRRPQELDSPHTWLQALPSLLPSPREPALHSGQDTVNSKSRGTFGQSSPMIARDLGSWALPVPPHF